MENASKALIMAGSVLIALMIIGALLLMINNLSSYQETDTKTARDAQVVEFNNQYETYNRKNVRGSDLYSLLNRAVDYNKRKSTKGTGDKDEGEYLAYQPMEITFDLIPLSGGDWKEKFWTSKDSNPTNHLIKESSYTVNDTSNKFKTDVYEKVKNLETTYGSDSLNNLVIGMSKIFLDKSNPTEDEKKLAVDTFNITSKNKKANDFSQLDEISVYRKDVYTYAEYVQFKRAKFDCVNTDDGVKYDQKTGRIIKMTFKFTGNFE